MITDEEFYNAELRLNYILPRDCSISTATTCTGLIHPQSHGSPNIVIFDLSLESCSRHPVIMWDENFTIFRLEFKFRKQTSQQQSQFLLITQKQKPYLEFFVNYMLLCYCYAVLRQSSDWLSACLVTCYVCQEREEGEEGTDMMSSDGSDGNHNNITPLLSPGTATLLR